MPSNEAGVVSVAHPFLEDSFSKVFTEAIAGADQIVVPTVGLRKSTQDSPGDQPAIRQHGQHSLQKKKSLFWTHTRSPSSLVAGHCSLYVLCFRFCYPSICYQILEKENVEPTTDKLRTNRHRPSLALLQFSRLRSVFQERSSSTRFSPCRHVSTKRWAHTGIFDLSQSWRHKSPVRRRQTTGIYFNYRNLKLNETTPQHA